MATVKETKGKVIDAARTVAEVEGHSLCNKSLSVKKSDTTAKVELTDEG